MALHVRQRDSRGWRIICRSGLKCLQVHRCVKYAMMFVLTGVPEC